MKNSGLNRPTTPLTYLNLVSTKEGVALNEHPLTASLTLGRQADDSRLLIALSEVCGCNRPISPIRITRLDGALILWLDEQEWLVLPHAHYGYNLGQALEQSFGATLWLDPIPDGTFQAELTATALLRLQNADNQPLNGYGASPRLQSAGNSSVCIRPWTLISRYGLLMSKADKACLEDGLQGLQSTLSLS